MHGDYYGTKGVFDFENQTILIQTDTNYNNLWKIYLIKDYFSNNLNTGI